MMVREQSLELARALVAARLGLDFPPSKNPDLERGLARMVEGGSTSSVEEYVGWMAAQPAESPEWNHLARALTVGETYFLRDQACFEALESRVLPELIAARCADGSLRLRLWSAGCSTGEEPYSLAILLDRLLPSRRGWTLTIHATDINHDSLNAARLGQYREWSLRQTPDKVRDRYFRKVRKDLYEIIPAIREMVTFAPLNLAEDGYPAILTNTNAMDLVLCRNVIMYFTAEVQRAVADRLSRALLPDGWLVVSPVEASSAMLPSLKPAHCHGAILYQKQSNVNGAALNGSLPASIPVRDLGATEGSLAPREGSAGKQWKPVPQRPSVPTPAPAAPRDLLREAMALADSGQLEEAKRVCKTKLAQDRLNLEAHLLLSAICRERGEQGEARDALRRALYLAPDSIMAHFLLGSLLFSQGALAKSQRCMETALSLLQPQPQDQIVPESGGLTAGVLLETVRGYTVMLGQKQTAMTERTPLLHPSDTKREPVRFGVGVKEVQKNTRSF